MFKSKTGKITITTFISGQGVKTLLISVVDVEMWLFELCLSPMSYQSFFQ